MRAFRAAPPSLLTYSTTLDGQGLREPAVFVLCDALRLNGLAAPWKGPKHVVTTARDASVAGRRPGHSARRDVSLQVFSMSPVTRALALHEKVFTAPGAVRWAKPLPKKARAAGHGYTDDAEGGVRSVMTLRGPGTWRGGGCPRYCASCDARQRMTCAGGLAGRPVSSMHTGGMAGYCAVHGAMTGGVFGDHKFGYAPSLWVQLPGKNSHRCIGTVSSCVFMDTIDLQGL